MPRHHHVNLGVPVDGIEAEADWLVNVLGYRKMNPDPSLVAMGANWFEGDDGGQIHLSKDPDHRPAAAAHVAITVDDIATIERTLGERGVAYQAADREGLHILICRDPAGNRWEIRGELREALG